jgi:low temperature requirement protein LtrA
MINWGALSIAGAVLIVIIAVFWMWIRLNRVERKQRTMTTLRGN